MSALRSATITQAMICKIKTGMNGLKWSFAPIKEDRGAFKSTKQIAFWNFFSHLTVIFQVKIDIIWTKTCNDLEF